MKKQILTVLAVIIFLIPLSINDAKALPLQSTATLSLNGVLQQTPTGTYTYIISVSRLNYQMKNGATGQVIYQSVDAAQVINNAMNNLNQGNSIEFDCGNIQLES